MLTQNATFRNRTHAGRYLTCAFCLLLTGSLLSETLAPVFRVLSGGSVACDMACCDEANGEADHYGMPACGDVSPGEAGQPVHIAETTISDGCSVKCARVPAGFARGQSRGAARIPAMVKAGAVAGLPGIRKTDLLRDVFTDSSISPRAPPFSHLRRSPA